MNVIRALAIGCALLAARRWPAFGVAAGLLGAEHLAGELSEALTSTTTAALAWASPIAAASGCGTSLALPSSKSVPAWFAGASGVALLVTRACPRANMLTAAMCCACALAVMVARVDARNAGRVAVLLLLAGNVAVFALAAVVGVDVAYGADLVLWSNGFVHASIAGLALWTMARR